MEQTHLRKGLFDTEDRTIFCASTGREYHLSVWLPQSYATTTRDYPVIYLLDGDLLFGMAAGLTVFLHWGGTPEAIVVGVNYDMESYDQLLKLRELDFKIPEITGALPDSYADKFLHALIHEMIPLIEANYRTVPTDRCLCGYSSGGFFVLYGLFNQPDAFQRYITGSGCLDGVYPYLIKHDQKLADRKSSDPIQLYMSVGELEENQVPSFHQLASFIKAGNYPGLALATEIYPGEGHTPEGLALTYFHGIRHVY